MMHIVEKVWRRQTGSDWFFLSSKTTGGAWKDHPFRCDEVDSKIIGEFCRDNKRRHLYFFVTGFSRPIRRKQYALGGHYLFADLDAVDPEEIEWEPTVAWESSPGRFQCVWQVDRFNEQLNVRLTRAINSDPSGADLTQVLRIPGTR